MVSALVVFLFIGLSTLHAATASSGSHGNIPPLDGRPAGRPGRPPAAGGPTRAGSWRSSLQQSRRGTGEMLLQAAIDTSVPVNVVTGAGYLLQSVDQYANTDPSVSYWTPLLAVWGTATGGMIRSMLKQMKERNGHIAKVSPVAAAAEQIVSSARNRGLEVPNDAEAIIETILSEVADVHAGHPNPSIPDMIDAVLRHLTRHNIPIPQDGPAVVGTILRGMLQTGENNAETANDPTNRHHTE